MATPLPPLRTMWDFGDPAASEARFRAALPAAEASGDRAYLCELKTQIARAEGLQQKFDDALRTLDGAEPLRGEGTARAGVYLLLERGRVLNSSKRAAEARPLFLRAWDEARAAGLDGPAVDAAHMAAIVETPEGAMEWNLRALALAESSADPDARAWAGPLSNNVGWTLHGKGDFAGALERFEKALRFAEAKAKPEGIRVARWCVARCLRSLGRVEEALAGQRALFAETEAAGSPDGFVHEEAAECLLALGRTDEARPFFRTAHGLLSKDRWLVRDEPARLERLRRIGEGGAP